MCSLLEEKISSTRVDSLATLLLFFDDDVRNNEKCFNDWWTVWSTYGKSQPSNWQQWMIDVKSNLNYRNILNYLNEENNVTVLVFSDRSVSNFSPPDEKGHYYPSLKPFDITHYKEQFDFSNYVSIYNTKPPMFFRNVMISETKGYVILVIAPGPRTKPWYYHNKKLKMFESSNTMIESATIYNLKYFRDVVLPKYQMHYADSEIYKTMLQYLKKTRNSEYLDVAKDNEKLDSFELVYQKLNENMTLTNYVTHPKETEPKPTPDNLPPTSFTETANKFLSAIPEPIQNFVSCPFTPPHTPFTPHPHPNYPPMIPTFGERKKPTSNYDESPAPSITFGKPKETREVNIVPKFCENPTEEVNKYLRSIGKMSKLLPHATPEVREYFCTHTILTPRDEMPAEAQEFVKKLEEETLPTPHPNYPPKIPTITEKKVLIDAKKIEEDVRRRVEKAYSKYQMLLSESSPAVREYLSTHTTFTREEMPAEVQEFFAKLEENGEDSTIKLEEPKKTPSLFYNRSLIKSFEEFMAQSNIGTNPKLPDFGLRNVTSGQTIIQYHTFPIAAPSCTFSADPKCMNQDNGSLAIFGFDYFLYPETDLGFTIDDIDKVVNFLTNPRNYDPTFIAKHTLQFKKFTKISKTHETRYIVAVYYH
jgi:hypothetical protein